MLESIASPDDMSSILIERTWLAKHRAKENDWPGYCAKLRNAFDLFAKIDATTMASAIAPVQIRAINENLGDAKGALDASANISKVADDSLLYRSALAKVMSDAGDFPAALVIWREALPRWPTPEGDIAAAFAFRTAAIASAMYDEWAEAGSFFEAAERLVDPNERPAFALGLKMDVAFCRYNARDRSAAVSTLGAVVAALQPMQADHEVEPLLSLQRRAGGRALRARRAISS